MASHDWSLYRGKCDLVIGGPPCQAFSMAGFRRSLGDERGNLTLLYGCACEAFNVAYNKFRVQIEKESRS
jgi:DNA (cytosine-5)-methyltransferase 1